MLSVSVLCVRAMQDKLVAVVQDSLDVMQKKMVHNIKEFTSLDVSFVWCMCLFSCQDSCFSICVDRPRDCC